jgi:hypothetical protein
LRDDVAERFFVRAGDVIFRARGDHNSATALVARFAEPAVAILPLIVLRPKPIVVTAGCVIERLSQRDLRHEWCLRKP